jgi:predicted nucleic acid-binding protein
LKIAYADASVFAALAFREPNAGRIRRRLAGFDRVVTSVLTEAELASALRRERIELPESPLRGVQLIGAPDPLSAEIQEVLGAGYLRGADCWHVAVALNYSPDRDLVFFTLDNAQRSVAAKLGFTI